MIVSKSRELDLKYIHYGPAGWEFDPYFNYVELIKTELPQALYEFASDYDNYNLTSHTSLHDAWLEELSIRDSSTTFVKKPTGCWRSALAISAPSMTLKSTSLIKTYTGMN